MSDQTGVLITFEGSEGCGKSTQITRLFRRLKKQGYDPLVTREPGGTAIGEEIRHLLKHSDAGFDMCPETELLLFAASRAQLVREVIEPAIEAGKIILCDRFLDSTTVYQGVARKISADPVQMINQFAVGDRLPDLTIILDVSPELGFERIQSRNSDLPDRMEQESIEFYQRVREGYLILAKGLPERFLVIDGSQDEAAIEEKIWEEIEERFIEDFSKN